MEAKKVPASFLLVFLTQTVHLSAGSTFLLEYNFILNFRGKSLNCRFHKFLSNYYYLIVKQERCVLSLFSVEIYTYSPQKLSGNSNAFGVKWQRMHKFAMTLKERLKKVRQWIAGGKSPILGLTKHTISGSFQLHVPFPWRKPYLMLTNQKAVRRLSNFTLYMIRYKQFTKKLRKLK